MLWTLFIWFIIIAIIVYIVAYIYAHIKGKNGFGRFTTADEVVKDIDLTGKVIIVTGSNCGIGEETVKSLKKRGCHVIIAARDEEKSLKVKKELEKIDQGKVTYIPLDLGSLESIEKFVKNI